MAYKYRFPRGQWFVPVARPDERLTGRVIEFTTSRTHSSFTHARESDRERVTERERQRERE